MRSSLRLNRRGQDVVAELYSTLDAVGLAARIRSGEVSRQEVLETAIARAEEIDPTIHAIVDRMYELILHRVRKDARVVLIAQAW